MNYIVKTSGLMCGHCDATVETALLNVAGVTDADADHETQTVQVECADTVTAEQLGRRREVPRPVRDRRVAATHQQTPLPNQPLRSCGEIVPV